MTRPALAAVLAAALVLTGCTASPKRTGYRHTQGPYTVQVSHPRWVSGPHLPVDVTLTNTGGPTVTHPMPEEDRGCGLGTVTLKNVVTAAQIRPSPEPKPGGCHTDALVLQLEAGQTVKHRFWYSVRGVPTGTYSLPLDLPPEFGAPEIEVEVRH
ncbi:hypothetical protein [Deinococcus sp. SL84]|uniref:hypothetical protein n=1 Tax=Deinococcus sp. SL84 TaxID=2994663 RepID=UPI0022756DE7|nr:hypothetical protein [Deinococcus sp. SL84]MCY1702572.1 hypothetical protein [Deinococcus sp. SL84]